MPHEVPLDRIYVDRINDEIVQTGVKIDEKDLRVLEEQNGTF